MNLVRLLLGDRGLALFRDFDQMLDLLFLREGGIELQQFLPGRYRGVRVALAFPFNHPEVVERSDVLRVVGQRLLQLCDGAVDVTSVIKARSIVGTDSNVLRIDFQRLLEIFRRQLELMGSLVSQCCLVQQGSIFWLFL